MLTWEGLLGKMIDFAIKKIVDKKIDFSLDERKKAARTFLRLHYLLEELTKLSEDITNNLDNPNRDNGYYIKQYWLHKTDDEIARISNEYLHLSHDLEEVIDLYDPILSHALHNLYDSKYSLLYIMSHSFILTEDNEDKLEISFPTNKLLEIDFEEHYLWINENPEYYRDTNLEWPHNALLGFYDNWEELEQKFVISQQYNPLNNKQYQQIKSILSHHRNLTLEANQRLAEFIKNNFSLTDILYCK